ncbi:MAG: inner membrane CreD family protein [Candidatus Eremiobacteraeota bacterium]|nr:inner membrane CreD family protein [Candidatus Eremiobacteraeota bacterium]
MFKRIFVIAFIYICTVIAWFVLGQTVDIRTRTQDNKLRLEVGQLWGTVQRQEAPSVFYRTKEIVITKEETDKKDGKIVRETKTITVDNPISLDAGDINVDLKLDYRKKGLLWYSTYRVGFSGIYRITNNTGKTRKFHFTLNLPSKGSVYDNFRLVLGNREVTDIQIADGRLHESLVIEAGKSENVEVGYFTQGMDEWWYNFGTDVTQIKNFSLVMNTNFDKVDFPQDSISPTEKQKTDKGWKLTWKYSNLLSGAQIGMDMPKKLNPGPWVSKVIYFAPVSLFLFFFLLFIFTTMKKVNVHPMNYFFIGCAFFAYHLLLAYLVDHVSIHASFWICSAVSIFLVISYMRLVVGYKFAFLEVGLSQLIFLVFFSYTFFFKGYTGLAVTIMCIATLFVVMQLTGKIDWGKIDKKDEKPPGNDKPMATLVKKREN